MKFDSLETELSIWIYFNVPELLTNLEVSHIQQKANLEELAAETLYAIFTIVASDCRYFHLIYQE